MGQSPFRVESSLWTSDQSDAETSIWQHTHNRQTSMASVGFEPAIPVKERPQTHILPRPPESANGVRACF